VCTISNPHPTTDYLRAYMGRSPLGYMRGTSDKLSCYDCRECIDTDGTRHGFCKVEQVPVGGLDWNDEDFDKFPAHIPPRLAGTCWRFGAKTPAVLRTYRLIIHVSNVERLREVFGNLKGGTTE
jgi:hypothetical protein